MSHTPDISEYEHLESDPTVEMDLNHVPNTSALQSLVDEFSEKFNDDIRDDLESTIVQAMPEADNFRSLNDWNQRITADESRCGTSAGHDVDQPKKDHQFEQYAEIMAIIRSYEKMLEEDYDLGISVKNYPEIGTFRLLSLSVYRSGSVTLLGTDKSYMPINVYEKIENISFAVQPLKREKKEKARNKISFFFHEQTAV